MSIINLFHRTFFDGYNSVATTNYVYNSDGDTDAEAGWVRCVGDDVIVMYNVATLTATTLSYRIEGRYDSSTRALEISGADKTTTSGIDQVVSISAYPVKEVRVGVKIDADNPLVASPNLFYSSVIVRETK